MAHSIMYACMVGSEWYISRKFRMVKPHLRSSRKLQGSQRVIFKRNDYNLAVFSNGVPFPA